MAVPTYTPSSLPPPPSLLVSYTPRPSYAFEISSSGVLRSSGCSNGVEADSSGGGGIVHISMRVTKSIKPSQVRAIRALTSRNYNSTYVVHGIPEVLDASCGFDGFFKDDDDAVDEAGSRDGSNQGERRLIGVCNADGMLNSVNAYSLPPSYASVPKIDASTMLSSLYGSTIKQLTRGPVNLKRAQSLIAGYEDNTEGKSWKYIEATFKDVEGTVEWEGLIAGECVRAMDFVVFV